MKGARGSIRFVLSVAVAGTLVSGPVFAVQELPEGPWTTVQETELHPAGTGANFWLGRHVDLEGDTLAVSGGLGLAGAVYVYERGTGGWIEQAYLRPAEQPLTGALALSGDTLAVSAYTDDQAGFQSGAVYVYVRDGDAWAQQALLRASDAMAEDRFGWALGLDGETLVIGAPRHLPHERGAAYVFRRTGTSWVEEQRLEAPGQLGADWFGEAVAVDGERVAIGAPTFNFDRGACFVFVNSGATWTYEATLHSPTPMPNDFVGWSVALEGDTLAVGGPEVDDLAGVVYVFERDAGGWGAPQELTATHNGPTGRLGWSLDLAGDLMVAGQPVTDEGDIVGGAAMLFERLGSEWSALGRLVPDDPTDGAQFGRSVAVDAATVAVGAHLADTNGFNSGAAYLFSPFEGVASNYCAARDNSTNVPARMALFGDAALPAPELRLHAQGCPVGAPGLFFYGTATAALPFGDGLLCVSPFTPGFVRLEPVVTADPFGSVLHELLPAELPPDTTAGTTLYFQFWFRDLAAGAAGFNLSDALGVSFGV